MVKKFFDFRFRRSFESEPGSDGPVLVFRLNPDPTIRKPRIWIHNRDYRRSLLDGRKYITRGPHTLALPYFLSWMVNQNMLRTSDVKQLV